jgi:hypothetical protein
VFEALSSSYCNPHDYACICGELEKLDIGGKVKSKCSPKDFEEYVKFLGSVCHPAPPPPPTPTPMVSSEY